MYLGEPDGKSAGGMLFKFNVKTGETKILMSKSTGIEGGKGIIPTFRSAFKMNGKLYFEGMIMDTNNKELTQQEIQTAMAYQNGFPASTRSIRRTATSSPASMTASTSMASAPWSTATCSPPPAPSAPSATP